MTIIENIKTFFLTINVYKIKERIIILLKEIKYFINEYNCIYYI